MIRRKTTTASNVALSVCNRRAECFTGVMRAMDVQGPIHVLLALGGPIAERQDYDGSFLWRHREAMRECGLAREWRSRFRSGDRHRKDIWLRRGLRLRGVVEWHWLRSLAFVDRGRLDDRLQNMLVFG